MVDAQPFEDDVTADEVADDEGGRRCVRSSSAVCPNAVACVIRVPTVGGVADVADYRSAMANVLSPLVDESSILPPSPVDESGQPLEVIHDREYRVRAYKKASTAS